MVFVHFRTSFFCLRVRAGLFLVNLFAMMGGAFVAVLSWLQVLRFRTPNSSVLNTIAIYILATVYSLLVILSLFGLLGVFLKRLRMIRMYRSMITIHLGLNLLSGAFYLFTFFRFNPRVCLNNSSNESTNQICGEAWSAVTAATLTILVTLWLAEFYGILISDNYAEELYVDDAARIPDLQLAKSSV